jgi:poly-gamma-glutamate synthesis protein (capsule biosynthesis protein)
LKGREKKSCLVVSTSYLDDALDRFSGYIDSTGALYLQTRLQKECYGARPLVIANHNSAKFVRVPPKRTTSYLTILYARDELHVPDDRLYAFGGDTFFGRFMSRALARPDFRRRLEGKLLELRKHGSLLVNLEGVLVPTVPLRPRHLQLVMPRELSLEMLGKAGVRAVSLANNHANDSGAAAKAAMREALVASGVVAIDQGEIHDFGPFQLVAFSDLDNNRLPTTGILDPEMIAAGLAGRDPQKPLFAFLHWGREYSAVPREREMALRDVLVARGVELIVGAHPHCLGGFIGGKDHLTAFSLGNFLFDQAKPHTNGGLLEVRFFPQGTYFPRLISLGNLYADCLRPH